MRTATARGRHTLAWCTQQQAADLHAQADRRYAYRVDGKLVIEDPIEYLFEENQCQFEQREVGVDTESFANGIRNAMRQDPEVIFIGEVRDRDSIEAAMQAAETEHLVLATLHADSVNQAIDRETDIILPLW